MRLFRKECRKMFSDTGIWVIFAVCLLFNLVIILFYSSLQEIEPAACKAVSDEVLCIEPDNQCEYLEKEISKVNELFMMQYLPDADAAPEKEIEGAADYPKYCADLFMEQQLYDMVLQEVNQVYTYQEYLKEIEEQNQTLTGMQDFLGMSEYETRRLHKVESDYAQMKDLKLSYVRSYGISKGLQFFPAHVLALLMAFALVIRLYLKDREQGYYVMFGTMCHGRRYLRAVRFLTIFLGILLTTGGILLESMLLFGWLYGMPADTFWNAPVQAFYGARSAVLRISIGQMLLLSYIGLSMACFLIIQLVLLVGRWISNMNLLYGGGFAILLGETILYFQIGVFSRYAVLKWLNVTALLNPQYGLMNYKVLNVFHYPMSYVTLAVIVLVVLSLVCVTVNSILPVEHVSKTDRRIRRNKRSGKKRRHVYHGLWMQEMRKLLIDSHGLLVLMVTAVFGFWIYNSYEEKIYDLEELFYKEYVAMVEGTYSDASMDLLNREWTEVQQAYGGFSGNSYVTDAKQGALQRCIAYGNYLAERPGSSFVYEKGYERLYMERMRSLLYMTWSMTLIVLVTSFFWSMEQTSGMSMVQEISTVGEKRVRRIKTVQAAGITLLLFGCVYGSFFEGINRVYGLDVLHVQARSLMGLDYVPAWVSLGGFLAMVFGIRLFMLLAAGAAVRKISYRLHSTIEVILVSESFCVMGLLLLYVLMR